MKLSFSILFLFLVLSACSNHHPAPVENLEYNSAHPLSKQNKFRPNYITVKKGDTLYSIGFNHNIDYKILAQINHINSPYRIYPGQKISLNTDKASNNTTKNTEVVTTPIKQSPKLSSQNTKSQAVSKPIITPIAKPVSKPNLNPPTKTETTAANNTIEKPIQKPIKKPIKKPIQQAPSSNSQWIWPVQGQILSSFSNSDATRKGIDIRAKIGEPVYASNNGVVVYSGNGLLGYGELIIIKHSDSLLSAYANNSSRNVNEGDTVKQGEVIAKSGKSSDGTPLLHFEIRKNGQPVNPINYLPKQ
jgi:lipoprotein NlpD